MCIRDRNTAMNAVVRGKNIKEQAEVDAMAKAIENAIAALELKSTNTNTETNNTNQDGAQSETCLLYTSRCV